MIPTMEEINAMTCEELYSLLNKRMTTALMFHSKMSDYFNFLGLHGFKRIHEYQYVKESMSKRKLNRTYIDMHSKLLPEKSHDKVEVTPKDWYKYTRMDVDDATISKYTRIALKTYLDWETETKTLIERIGCSLFSKGNLSDYQVITNKLKDVNCEIMHITRLIGELNGANYDTGYILEKQKCLHNKYKEKMKKLRV